MFHPLLIITIFVEINKKNKTMKQIYTLALISLGALQTQAQALNVNGSLESWADGTQSAEGWYMGTTVPEYVVKQTGNAQDGTIYVKLLPKQGNSGNNKVGLLDIDVVGGGTYTISYWYKSEGTDFKFKHWAQVRNNSSDLPGTYTNFQPTDFIAPNTSGTWKQVIITETLPTNATKLRLTFRNYVNSSAALIDNVAIYQGTADVKVNEITGLTVYPNPATDVVTIASNTLSTKFVEIFDIVGKKVMETQTDGTINVSGLNKGVYILNIEENGKKASRKLVIN